MVWNKITHHRDKFENFATKKIKNSSGTEFSFGSISSEQVLKYDGSNIVGYTHPTGAYCAVVITGSNAAENYIASGIWSKLSGSTVAAQSKEFSTATSNKLLYQGSSTSKFLADYSLTAKATITDNVNIDAALSVSSSAGGQVVESGSMSSVTLISGSTVPSTVYGCLHGSTIISLASGQAVELFAKPSANLIFTGSSVQIRLSRIL